MRHRVGPQVATRGASVLAVLACGLLAGPVGAGIRNAETVSASAGGGSGSPKSVEVECPAGTFALGGGSVISGSTAGVAMVTSQPLLDAGSGEPIGWYAESTEVIASTSSWSLIARASCGRVEGIEHVVATSASTSESKSVEVSCPPGKSALSGGFALLGSTQGVVVYASEPLLDPVADFPIGWRVGGVEEIATTGSWSIRAEVLCTDDAILAVRAVRVFTNDQFSDLTLSCLGWVATGGGAGIPGLIVEWLSTSGPDFTTGSWASRFQRQAGVTENTDQNFWVLCPEPNALAAEALALAAVATCAKRQAPRARQRRSSGIAG